MRANRRQIESMIQFMTQHTVFARGAHLGFDGEATRAGMWQQLTNALNALGSQKDPKQWQVVSIFVSTYQPTDRNSIYNTFLDVEGPQIEGAGESQCAEARKGPDRGAGGNPLLPVGDGVSNCRVSWPKLLGRIGHFGHAPGGRCTYFCFVFCYVHWIIFCLQEELAKLEDGGEDVIRFESRPVIMDEVDIDPVLEPEELPAPTTDSMY